MLYILIILATLAILTILWEVKLRYDEQKASYDDAQTFSDLDELFDYIENSSMPVKTIYRSQNKQFSPEENLIKPLESKYKLDNIIVDSELPRPSFYLEVMASWEEHIVSH